MHKIKVRLSKLLKKQEPVESYFTRLSMGRSGPARTPKPPSPKVARPKIHTLPTYPGPGYTYHKPPVPPKLSHRAPVAPTWGGLGIGEIPFVPPPVPEIPTSPTYSSASSHTYSNNSTESEPVAHWAMKIFNGRHTNTKFHTLADRTICVGKDEPRAIEMLDDDGFEQVLEVPFEAADVLVRLYWRSDDSRARILFLTKDATGRRTRQCFPLTSLKILRKESCLQLCRVNRRDGQLDLWARLRFTLYERRLPLHMIRLQCI
jgi:hypothetical protein